MSEKIAQRAPTPVTTKAARAARANGAKGGRPRSGEVKWERGQWWARLRYTDGARRWRRLDPAIAESDEDGARTMALDGQARIDRRRLVLADETVGEWFTRYLAWRTAQGFATVAETRSRAGRILDVLQHKDVARFTTADVEDVRDALDREVRAGVISWKTAFHTWSDLRCACRAMTSSKDRALRARKDDPSRGVLPPDKGADKAKTIVFPDEFAALLACEDVPFAYRVLYALAIYSGLRAGEIEALTVRDVNLAHGFFHVNKAVSRKTGKVGPTKHEHAGNVPIEPALVPLLRVLTERRQDDARLVWMPVDEDRAPALRRHLRAAGVTRAQIETRDARNKRLVFHDLRATHLTWRACRGDAAVLIQAVARHASFQTTLGYIHRATLLSGIGASVFAPLPRELPEVAALGFVRVLDTPPSPGRVRRENHPAFFQRPQWELNPCYRRERPAS